MWFPTENLIVLYILVNFSHKFCSRDFLITIELISFLFSQMIVGCHNFFLKILIFEIIISDSGLWPIFMIDLKKPVRPILCLADFKTYMYMIGYVHKIFRIGHL